MMVGGDSHQFKEIIRVSDKLFGDCDGIVLLIVIAYFDFAKQFLFCLIFNSPSGSRTGILPEGEKVSVD